MYINTVNGKVSPHQLGFCQCHEHLYIRKGYSAQINPNLCIDSIDNSGNEMLDYRNRGGSAVVDAQPIGCGRDAVSLQAISLRSGVKIIASTGFHKPLFYPQNHWIFSMGQDEISNIFIHEITKGIFNDCDISFSDIYTDILAGQIKTAIDEHPFDNQAKKMFLAAINASTITGAPIMVHIEKNSDPINLINFLSSNGMDLRRVVFCHMDRASSDISVLIKALQSGVTLELDTIARDKYHSDNEEISIVKNLLNSGFESQIIMSLDVTRARLKSYGGHFGLGYILETFIPKMLTTEISPQEIDSFFITNPREVYSIN